MKSLLLTFALAVLLAGCGAVAHAGTAVEPYLKKPDDWFRSAEAARITANILSYQAALGGWPKNGDTTAAPYTGDPAELHGTFDNSATTGELRFLARAYNATKEPRIEKAFLKGLDYILQAQYPTGGWPQYYPPGNGYNRYITFNDNAMVRLLEFLREVATTPTYAFVDAGHRQAAKASFDRGIQCILKCQIKVNGKLTAWCAQHDEKDYSPRPARKFELVSFSGSESVGITRLLMSLDNPSPEVIQAVQGAVAWFESAKLTGIKVVQQPDKRAPKGTNKVVVADPNAPPVWARFYDIATNQPFFCDRDGVPKPSIAEIGTERRNGYAWYGNWPESLLAKDYPAWKAKWAARIGTP